MFWFHCGRCGSLFQSESGESVERHCAKCGFDPSPGVQNQAPNSLPAEQSPATESEEATESTKRAKQKVKRRKNRHLMLKVFGGWTLLLAVIFLTVRHKFRDETAERIITNESTRSAPEVSTADQVIIEKHSQACAATLAGFLSQTAPEQCSDFILTPTESVGRMIRFQSYNSVPKIDPQHLVFISQTVLHFPDGEAIESRWSAREGFQLETVFRESQGDWKLDWDHFARFSDYSWSLFLAGSGPDECEFRLLARERLVEERLDKDKTISVVFYAPRFGQPLETGFQSPEFLVPRDTLAGKTLEGGFRDAAANQQAFGSKLPNPNPEGLIRVRVKVKRSELNGERRFEVVDIPACHWYSSDDPGVVPATAGEATPAGQN